MGMEVSSYRTQIIMEFRVMKSIYVQQHRQMGRNCTGVDGVGTEFFIVWQQFWHEFLTAHFTFSRKTFPIQIKADLSH